MESVFEKRWSRDPSRRVESRRASRGRGRSQRGVAMVEAAIATPVFLALIFGIIEISLAMNDYLAVSSAVRAGSRTASGTGDDLLADYSTMKVVVREASAVSRDDVVSIVVYRADAFGAAPSPACQAGTPVAGECNVFTPADFDRPEADFGCTSTSPDRYWCPRDRKVSLTGSGTEFVGVWMKVRHRWVTKMFGSSMDLTDSSVIRLEPRTVN